MQLTRDYLGNLFRQTTGAVRRLVLVVPPRVRLNNRRRLLGDDLRRRPGRLHDQRLPRPDRSGCPPWAGDVTSGVVGSGCGGNTCCWSGPAVTSVYPDGTAVLQGQAFITNVGCLYTGAIGLAPCSEVQSVTSTCWYLVLPVVTGPLVFDSPGRAPRASAIRRPASIREPPAAPRDLPRSPSTETRRDLNELIKPAPTGPTAASPTADAAHSPASAVSPAGGRVSCV